MTSIEQSIEVDVPVRTADGWRVDVPAGNEGAAS